MKQFLPLLALLPSLLFAQTVWNGTADSTWYTSNKNATTYTISTAEQLAGLAGVVNRGTNFEGKTINLAADIVLNNTAGWENWNENSTGLRQWIAIGTSSRSFQGTFDGAGHIISGMYISVTSSYQGLFGYSSGTIKNLGVVASLIEGNTWVGGLVGRNAGGTISNSYATGNVSGTSSYVGGLAGYNYGGTISNSYATGSVSGTGSNVGGLVGYISGGTISNSYYDSETSGRNDTRGTPKTTEYMKSEEFVLQLNDYAIFSEIASAKKWEYNAGGYPKLSSEYLPAFNNVADFFESGDGTEGSPYIIKNKQQLMHFANIVNLGKDNFANKYVALGADIKLNDTTGWEEWNENSAIAQWTPIGGYTSASVNAPFNGTFDGAGHIISGMYISVTSYYQGLFGYSTGTIKNLGMKAFYAKGGQRVGGLVGSGNTITDSYAIGNVSGTSHVGGLVGYSEGGTIANSYATGSVSGTGTVISVGGLVGSNYGTISNSYATGNVSATGGQVGGLVGWNSGTISNSYATGNVGGTSSYVGGLAGRNNGGTISNSYATGSVSGTSSYVGGLVGGGTNGGTTSNSYYDKDKSGATGSGTGLTTNEMKNLYCISNWDFDSTWAINPSVNDGYPFLLPRSYTTEGKNQITASDFYLANQRQKNDTIPTTIVFHTGSPVTPAVDSIIFNKTKLAKGTDYDVLYYNNTEISNSSTAKIIIQSKGNYYGVKVFDFYITDFRNIAANTVTVAPIPDQLQTGSTIRYKPVVKDYSNAVTLREDTDYLLYYQNNREVGTATIEIRGMGIYEGDGSSKTVTFKIVDAKQLSGSTTASIVDSIRYVYSGEKITPEVRVSYNPESLTLVKDMDYTVSYGDNTNVGTGTITITGIGNYIGTIQKSFPIATKNLAASMAAPIPEQKYEGSPIMPIVTLTDGTKTLALGTDYTVNYYNNDEPGRASIIIAGKGNYSSSITVDFTIYENESDIKKTDVAVVWQDPFDFEYNGQNRCPRATATLPSGAPLALSISCTAVNARTTPYIATATYPNTAYNLLNNTAQFTISQARITATLEIPNIIQGAKLAPTVKGTKETGAINYWYSTDKYSAYTQTAPATEGVYYAYAIVSPTSNYLGTTTDTISFSIYKSEPPSVQVTWSGPYEFTYNGTEQSPGASLSGMPFTLVVKGATEAGTHTAVARFQTERTDYKLANAEKQFTIKPKPLLEDAIEPISNFFYTGLQIRPENITVKDGSKELSESIDYTLSYGENISELGTVFVTGKGNYSGNVSRHFPISSEEAAIVSVAWGSTREFVYDGTEHAPTATASNLELEILGKQTNAGSHTAVAQLKTANPNIILGNASIPYTIAKKKLEVVWKKETEYVYNKMTQGPTASVAETGVDLRVVNTYSGVGRYTAANGRAPLAIIASANAGNYELSNYSTDYEIKPRQLKPYFAAALPNFSTNKADTLWVPHEVFADSAALHRALSGLIDYDGFATDTINKASDDITALKGKPTVTLQYPKASPSMLQRRVETTQKATAIIVTDAVTADNYALTRPAIVIMATVEEDETAEKVFCQLGGNCALFSEEVCSAIGGKSVESCSDIKVACVINAYCVETSIENCRNGGGTAIGNSCSEASMLRPQLSGGSLRVWQTASGMVNVDLGYMPAAPVALQVYDLKGKLVASELVSTRFASVAVKVPSGVYLVRVGGRYAKNSPPTGK